MSNNENIQELSKKEKQYYLSLIKEGNYVSLKDLDEDPLKFNSKKGLVAVYGSSKEDVLFLLNPNVQDFDKNDKLTGVDFVSIKPLEQVQNLFEKINLTKPKFCVETIAEDTVSWAKPKYKENLLKLALQNNAPIPIDEMENNSLSKPGWNAIVDPDHSSKVLWLEFRNKYNQCGNPYGPTYVNMLPLEEVNKYERDYSLLESKSEFVYLSGSSRFYNHYDNFQEFVRNEVDNLQAYLNEEKQESTSLSKEEIKEWIDLVPKSNYLKIYELDIPMADLQKDGRLTKSGWYIVETNDGNVPLYAFFFDKEKDEFVNEFGPSYVALQDLESVNKILDANDFESFKDVKEFTVFEKEDSNNVLFLTEKEFKKHLRKTYGSDAPFWDDPKTAKLQQKNSSTKETTKMAKKNKALSAEEIAMHLEQAKALGSKTIEASEFIDNSPGENGGIFIVTAGTDEDGEKIANYEESTPIAILYFDTNGSTSNLLGPCCIDLTKEDRDLYNQFYQISSMFENSTTQKVDYSANGNSYLSKEQWEIEAKNKIEELVKFGFSPPANCPENLLPESYKSGNKKTTVKKPTGKVVSGLKETVKSDLSAVATRVAVKKSTELFSALIIDFLASNKERKEATAMKKKVKDLLSTEDGKAAFQILIGALLPMLTNSDKVPENIKDVIDTVGKGFRTDGMTHFAVEFVDYLSGPGAEKVRTTVIKAFESFKKLDEMTTENGEINVRALAEPTLSLLSLPSASKEEEDNYEVVETNVSELKQSLKNRRN
ncbi:MAG TPA: hypothetical protein PLP33_16375 [Leptospiraceae bacterium]|nr:hypothetical protein [Leptospiraceae bacterium]